MKLLFLVPLLALASLARGADVPWVERAASFIRPELRESIRRLATMDAEISTLPEPAGVRSGNRIGFQSARDASDAELWVDVELAAPAEVDSVVVVPAVVKGASGDVPGFGFPTRFMVVAYDSAGIARILLDETKSDFPNPGFYPVVARFAPIQLRRLRLTAISPWHPDGPSVLAFSELLALSGNRNVALGAKVRSGSSRESRPTWGRANVVDMNTPLGLPVLPSRGVSSSPLGYHSMRSKTPDTRKSFTIELPAAAALDEIRLVPVRRSEMPSWLAYGFPLNFFIETATEADFRDAQKISDHEQTPFQTPGQNLVCFPAGGRVARYVRFTATRLWERSGDYVLAMAELQAYSGGKNVALGAKVTALDSLDSPEWSPAALTDGNASGGRLLELPEWFRLLEKRRAIETARTALEIARKQLLEKTERMLVGGGIAVTGAAAALAAITIWIQHRNRRRERDWLRERLARDLHDELGSNLGSIALISSFAAQPEATPEAMRGDLAEIEKVARESVDSMHDMVALLGRNRSGRDGDWLTTLHHLAVRLLRGVELDCRLPAAPLPRVPDLETRRDLYLFCKEVLHNAAHHAHAAHVRFEIGPTTNGLRIEIADDGCGFDPVTRNGGFGLSNLRERAAAMHADLDIQSTPGSGTTVRLELPRTRRWRTT